MDIKHVCAELTELTEIIHRGGLIGEASAFANYFGDELKIRVKASELYDDNGYWNQEKSFAGTASNATALLGSARAWVAAIPGPEDRAAELMIRKLNEMADALPTGNSELATAAWAEIHKTLIAKAERIAKNGLPSPTRISELPKAG